jgi:hypothetical protein
MKIGTYSDNTQKQGGTSHKAVSKAAVR